MVSPTSDALTSAEIAAARLIGIDWGSTGLRSFIIGEGGVVIASAKAKLGASSMQGKDAFASTFNACLGDWIVQLHQAGKNYLSWPAVWLVANMAGSMFPISTVLQTVIRSPASLAQWLMCLYRLPSLCLPMYISFRACFLIPSTPRPTSCAAKRRKLLAHSTRIRFCIKKPVWCYLVPIPNGPTSDRAASSVLRRI